MIWSLIVGALIGTIAGSITKKKSSMGWIARIASGLIGSSFGQYLFGNWGPKLAEMAIIPSILGASILVLLVSALLGKNS